MAIGATQRRLRCQSNTGARNTGLPPAQCGTEATRHATLNIVSGPPMLRFVTGYHPRKRDSPHNSKNEAPDGLPSLASRAPQAAPATGPETNGWPATRVEHRRCVA